MTDRVRGTYRQNYVGFDFMKKITAFLTAIAMVFALAATVSAYGAAAPDRDNRSVRVVRDVSESDIPVTIQKNPYPVTLAGAKQAVKDFANGTISAAVAIAAVKAYANS